MSLVIQIGQGVHVLWGVENGPSLLLWPVAYTTACTTVQQSFLMNFCLRVVPRFGCNVNINKPLAACNGTSTQYMIFSDINSRVLVLIYYAALLPRREPHIASHSVCPPACLYVCMSVRLSVCLSVRPSRYFLH